jgi:hypothetical protein
VATFRQTYPIVYKPEDSVLGRLIEKTLAGEVIRFYFDDYTIYVPRPIYDKVKGWTKLPIESFQPITGRFWKSVKFDAITVRSDDLVGNITEIWKGNKRVEKVQLSSVVQKTMEGKTVRDIIKESSSDKYCSNCKNFIGMNCSEREKVIDKHSIRDLNAWTISPEEKNKCKVFKVIEEEIPEEIPVEDSNE